MQKTIYAIEIKCANEHSNATFPKYISGFHINFPWIYRFLHMSPSYDCEGLCLYVLLSALSSPEPK